MAQDFSAGEILEHVQLNNMLLAAKGWGVLAGLAVSEDSPVGMDVDVASGSCYIDSVEYTESSTVNLTIAGSHSTKYRKDLIIYDSSANNPAVIQGTNHDGGTSDPIYPPNISSGDILLAIVDVDASAGSIASTDIHDARVIVDPMRLTMFANDDLIESDDTEENTTSTTYVKLKEIEIKTSHLISGTLRFKYDLRTSSVNRTAYGDIRKNGVSQYSATEISTSYVTKGADLSGWAPGDLMQLYVHAYIPGGYSAYVRNFRVYGGVIPDWS